MKTPGGAKPPASRCRINGLSSRSPYFIGISCPLASQSVPGYNGLAAPKLHPNSRTSPDMPTKKLTAVSIPHLVEGEWYDAVLPGLILRVGVKRRTWQFRYHAGGSYHRKPLGHFPAMELGEARAAARKLLGRADMGVPVEASAP